MCNPQRCLVRLVLGHSSELLDKKTPEGHTHRWTVYLRSAGPCEFVDRSFVNKVVFDLHPDFANPHRVIKEPPFEVTETGYAGFSIPVSVTFSGISKPYKLHYDMNLFLDKYGGFEVEQIIEVKNPPRTFYDLINKYGGIVSKNDKKKQILQPPVPPISIKIQPNYPVSSAKQSKSSKPKAETKRKLKSMSIDEVERIELPPKKPKKASKKSKDPPETKEILPHLSEKSIMLAQTDEADPIETPEKTSKKNDQCLQKADLFEMNSLIDLQRKIMTLTDTEKIFRVAEAVVSSHPSRSDVHIINDNQLIFDLFSLKTSLLLLLKSICS